MTNWACAGYLRDPGYGCCPSRVALFALDLLGRCLQADSGKYLLCEAADHAALEGVGEVHDEVLDPELGVLVDDLGDRVGVAVQGMPGADVPFVPPGPLSVVADDALDLALVAEDRVELDGFQHRVVVTADRLAVLAQHIELVANGLDVRVEVARISVLRDELERDLLPRSADPDRRMRLLYGLGLVDCPADLVVAALERRLVLRPHRFDDLQRLAQHAQPFRRVGILVAVGTVLVVVPARADAEDEPAMAHHVDAA